MNLKFKTNILPNNAGIAKFNSHIIVVIVTIISSFNSTKLKIKTAAEPLITQSKILKLGIIEAIKYTQKSKFSAVI